MQLIHSDLKKGIVKIKITEAEDLWYVSHLIDPGDVIKGKTTRKIKIGEDANAKVVKKTMTLSVEAETISFSEDNSSLRINGKVREGPEDVPLGSYHAIAIEMGSEITLQKSIWLEYQKKKLKEATEIKYAYLLCIFDREEALFALTKAFGFEILVKIKGEVAKKNYQTAAKQDFYQEIIKALEVYAGRYEPERIIIASPAFYKEDLFKRIHDKELKQKIVLAVCSDVSEQACDEVLKRPELASILQQSRVREEQLIVEELLAEVNKDNVGVYGWKEVIQAIEAGAVRSLLITDKFIQQLREEGKYTELDNYMKQVDSLQGEIHIISSEHEGGKKLAGLGGIAALLRYKV